MHRLRTPPRHEGQVTPSAVAIMEGRLRAALCEQGANPTWDDLHSHWLHTRECIEAAAEAPDPRVLDKLLCEAALHLLHLASHLDAMRTPGKGGAE